jgi:hypothetical protein
MGNRQRHNYKLIKVGVEKFFTTETKPRYKWLDRLCNAVYSKLKYLAWNVLEMNLKYNRVEYQQENYRDVYEKEYYKIGKDK